MTNILNKINSLFPISDDTVQVLKENVTCCRFPKKYQLIKADTYCKSAFFIEKGITRSFWLVDGEEVTTSFGRRRSPKTKCSVFRTILRGQYRLQSGKSPCRKVFSRHYRTPVPIPLCLLFLQQPLTCRRISTLIPVRVRGRYRFGVHE